MIKSKVNTYINIQDETLDPVKFQREWLQSVISTLKGISNGRYDHVKAVAYLIEIRNSFNLVSNNINDKLPSEERVLLKNIFSTSIHILNSAIKTRDYSKIGIVQSTVETVIKGW